MDSSYILVMMFMKTGKIVETGFLTNLNGSDCMTVFKFFAECFIFEINVQNL